MKSRSVLYMKKAGYFFFCFLPLLAAICLQILLTFPLMGLAFMKLCFSNIAVGQKVGFDKLWADLTVLSSNQTFNALVSILFSISVILIFSFWFTHQFDGNLKLSPSVFIKPSVIIGLVLLVPGLQILSSILTTISASLFPSWMKFYETLMETAGFTGKPSILLILYSILLGPIGEELIFRGVTLSCAKKALPFWAANLLQAFLFGVFHLNVIQGIYAFIIGIVLGYICHKGGSVYLSILLHITFNAWGTLMPSDLVIYENPILYAIFLIIVVFLAILGFYLFYKNAVHSEVKSSLECSDI